jgi:hypothetical protein
MKLIALILLGIIGGDGVVVFLDARFFVCHDDLSSNVRSE